MVSPNTLLKSFHLVTSLHKRSSVHTVWPGVREDALVGENVLLF